MMSKSIQDLVLLGDSRLYESCSEVTKQDIELIPQWTKDLHSVIEAIREQYGFGRGIAAPQLGIMKRFVYININNPWVLINPEIIEASEDTFEMWDDCMSLPSLLVKVKRHQKITVRYTDIDWNIQEVNAENDLSELLQHEIDHLNGILCTMRAINNKSFKWKKLTV